MLGLLFLLQLPVLVSPKCIQCASPTLLNQWQLTGLPTYPASLPFTPVCNVEQISDGDLDSSLKVQSCTSACFEMVIPSANQYHFVRGCHDDFIEAGVADQQVASENKCFYSKITDQVITSDDGKLHDPAVAVMHFVQIGDDSAVVNARISLKNLVTGTTAGNQSILKDLTCSETRPVKCVKSMYYDGSGEDNNKDSCMGGYCISIEGNLNGRKYIERGCAPISPYTKSPCVTMRTNSTFVAGPGEGSSLSREKRSLNVILDATECFCSTEYCNTSATHLRFALVFSMVILGATTRFLY